MHREWGEACTSCTDLVGETGNVCRRGGGCSHMSPRFQHKEMLCSYGSVFRGCSSIETIIICHP